MIEYQKEPPKHAKLFDKALRVPEPSPKTLFHSLDARTTSSYAHIRIDRNVDFTARVHIIVGAKHIDFVNGQSFGPEDLRQFADLLNDLAADLKNK